MSPTSTSVDSSTKERLERLKRDGETWDELSERITTTEEPIEVGAWSEEQADRTRAFIRESRENW